MTGPLGPQHREAIFDPAILVEPIDQTPGGFERPDAARDARYRARGDGR
jgi:hypothetical protein